MRKKRRTGEKERRQKKEVEEIKGVRGGDEMSFSGFPEEGGGAGQGARPKKVRFSHQIMVLNGEQGLCLGLVWNIQNDKSAWNIQNYFFG